MNMRAAVPAVLLALLVAGCGHNQSSAPATNSASPSASTASTTTAPPSSKAYDLGRGEIGRVAFWQFTGTATPWQRACESVVDNWQASDKGQPWWNRDEAVKGCVDRGNGPSDSTSSVAPSPQAATPKECPPQGANQIKIYSGDISCADANVIAARYDLQGQEYQQIDSVDVWTCYTGTADSRPLIFSCVSDKNSEFSVYPAP